MNKFVKFTPWCDCKFFCSKGKCCIKKLLKNKEIRFSTAFEFNDFRELGRTISKQTINTVRQNRPDQFIENLRAQALKLYNQNKKHFLNEARNLPYTKIYIDKLNKKLTGNQNLNDDELAGCITWSLYKNLGIFCVSDIDVLIGNNRLFAGDIMFGHYANKNEGIACVYKSKSDVFNKVDYVNNVYAYNIDAEEITENDRFNILEKTIIWEYEQEYRIFKTPGIYTMAESDIELSAIFYTSKFKQKDIDYLKKMNKECFDGKLNIEEVYPYINQKNGFMYDGDPEPKMLSELLEQL